MSRAEYAKRILIIIIALLVGALLVICTSTLTLIRHQQVLSVGTNENSAQELQILIDCTTPQGKCSKRGQAAQAAAIRNVVKFDVGVVLCAFHNPHATPQQTYDCATGIVAHWKK